MYEYGVSYHKTKDQEFVFYQNSQVFMLVNDSEIQCFVETILDSE